MSVLIRNRADVSIYVSCHKRITKPFLSSCFFRFIEVGKQLHAKSFYKFGDDKGNNISSKNASYNELTAQYWVWKNDNRSKIVGFSHYRRYFKNKRATVNKPFIVQVLKSKEIISILKKNDIICHKTNLGMVASIRIGTNASALRPKDIPVVRNIIFNRYGKNDASAFDTVMGRDWNYLLNMFICKKELANEYSSWLFEILSELENEVDESELIGHEKRIYGLWGEYLLSVFVEARKLKVYDCEVLFTESPYSPFTRVKSKVRIFLSKVKHRVFKR